MFECLKVTTTQGRPSRSLSSDRRKAPAKWLLMYSIVYFIWNYDDDDDDDDGDDGDDDDDDDDDGERLEKVSQAVFSLCICVGTFSLSWSHVLPALRDFGVGVPLR